MNKHLESLIDDIVKAVDEDVFTDYYDENTAIESESVEGERDILRDILEPYVEDYELMEALRKLGVEDFEHYEDALSLVGRQVFDE